MPKQVEVKLPFYIYAETDGDTKLGSEINGSVRDVGAMLGAVVARLVQHMSEKGIIAKDDPFATAVVLGDVISIMSDTTVELLEALELPESVPAVLHDS